MGLPPERPRLLPKEAASSPLSCSVDDLGEFVWIDSEEMYYHEEDVDRCPWCGEWFVKDDGHESELTGNCYCSEECREKADDCYISENRRMELKAA